MSLIYFHRFLIVCGILFAVTIGWHLVQDWRSGGPTTALLGGILCCAGGAALAAYLRTVRLPTRPAPRP